MAGRRRSLITRTIHPAAKPFEETSPNETELLVWVLCPLKLVRDVEFVVTVRESLHNAFC